MAQEIERKFLIRDASWRDEPASTETFRQFYLARRDGFSVRIRIIDEARAFLTMKTGNGLQRGEYEYELPLADARELERAHIGTVIEKRRHCIAHGRHVIEVDVFAGALAPLVVAEIELESAEDVVELPRWFGREITDDPAFSNVGLATNGLPEEFRT
ncbi:adenylate cyclase [Aureimonas endophytica]|uniref:Adenylate cyclase n=1 Tax=Aureimonas endophytica TaxID=2027858 RepID=A0A916ZXA7_9HYPH|nr:CYTH domain-containing protein [Aureimonas endophytica]GGE17719.1 adenylate cyclase [Aureimonas endophytica]